MADQKDERPIALDAYEVLAERFAALADTKAENAYVERPATLSLLPSVKGKRVLDAGCGPGSYSEWLVQRSATVLALDASPKMVQLAKQRLGSRAEVRQADLSKPLVFLKDKSFYIVLCPLVLDYIRDWSSVFTEFHRVLKNEGFLIFSVEHPFWRLIKSSKANYFLTEFTRTEWRGFGITVQMPHYQRPLEAMITPLVETGFIVENIIEARPTMECKQHDPETYEQLSKRPSFLCIRAKKK
jgi:ubiquinone/menaquinone biosynthesis C-methylase UbiE